MGLVRICCKRWINNYLYFISSILHGVIYVRLQKQYRRGRRPPWYGGPRLQRQRFSSTPPGCRELDDVDLVVQWCFRGCMKQWVNPSGPTASSRWWSVCMAHTPYSTPTWQWTSRWTKSRPTRTTTTDFVASYRIRICSTLVLCRLRFSSKFFYDTHARVRPVGIEGLVVMYPGAFCGKNPKPRPTIFTKFDHQYY